MRRRCVRWLREHIPGAFAQLVNEDHSPTAELITLRTGNPMREQGDSSPDAAPYRVPTFPHGDYLTLLGLTSDLDAWEGLETFAGLSIRVPETQRTKGPRMVLAARLGDFPTDESTKGLGRNKNESLLPLLTFLHESLQLFAISWLLTAYESEVADIRDGLGRVPIRRLGAAVTQLRKLEQRVARTSRDARPFCRDVATEEQWVFRYEIYPFASVFPKFQGEERLFERFRLAILRRVPKWLENESETRSVLLDVSNLTVAAANLRAARASLRLQWLLLVLTIATIALAALQVKDSLLKILHR